MNKQQEQELSNFLSAMYSAGLLERRIGANGEEEFRKTDKLQGLEAQEVLDICEEDIAKRCEEDEDERYCDNEDCPYGGYIYDEEIEKYKGKEYICIGCDTGKGLQEREQEDDEE